MKAPLIPLFVGIALGLLPLRAETLVSGIVQAIEKDGTLRLNPSQSGKPAFIFKGMDKVRVESVNGTPGNLESISPGMNVTIYQAQRGNQWVVTKVLIPDPPKGVPLNYQTPLPPSQVYQKPWRDKDITTQPGTKATIDRDITTQPTNIADSDGDRTTKRGSRIADRDADRTTKPAQGIADRDGDRTTRRTDNAARDNDITTVPDRRQRVFQQESGL